MNYPSLCYDNRFDDGAPVASTTEAGYNVANLQDWRAFTWWKPTALPATVDVDCGYAKAADYAVLVGHTLGSTGATLEIRGSTDNFIASDVLLASVAPDTDDPQLMQFVSASYKYFRYQIYGATNLMLYSEQFDNAVWTPAGVTITPDVEYSPTGTLTADMAVTSGAINDRLDYNTAITPSAGDTYTYSIWLKGSGNIDIAINTTTGVGGQTEITIPLTTTWTRYSVSVTYTSGVTGYVRAHAVVDRAGVATTLYMWGAQLEQRASAGPYKATTSAPTTVIPAIAIAAVGTALQIPGDIPEGFDPLKRAIQGSSNVSMKGNPLGRVYDFESWDQDIEFQLVTWSWLRATFIPAWKAHLRGSPCVFAWDPVSHADEIYLVTLSDGFDTPHNAGGFASLKLSMTGVHS